MGRQQSGKGAAKLVAGAAVAMLVAGAGATPPATSPDQKTPPAQPAPAAESTPSQTMPAEAKPTEAKPTTEVPMTFTTAGGVQVEELKLGEGPAVPVGGAVVVHYRGTLADGTEFDSSYKRNQPAAFSLQRLIKGWQEGIPGMKIGGKRKLVVPWALAYGEQGRPPRIPEKADLTFEIELVNFLQTEDTVVGTGAEVPFSPNATVNVHYRGTLLKDGQQFDSSYDRGQPIEFALNQVIPGWTWGVPGMKVGGKRKLIVPYQMAYGEQGMPPSIPAKADLVFEIELLGVR